VRRRNGWVGMWGQRKKVRFMRILAEALIYGYQINYLSILR